MGNLVLVDDRAGSVELAPHLKDSLLVRLEYGDVAFQGNGPDGVVKVGVEHKRVGDLLNSIQNGRLSGHQMPGMVGEYDRVYLIVEGLWREGEGGEVEVWKGRWRENYGRMKWSAVQGYLSNLEEMFGVRVRCTGSKGESVRVIEGLVKWWGKKWKGHRAHKVVYGGVKVAANLSGRDVSMVRKVASVLPGIGVQRAEDVEKVFGSVREMCESGEEEWVKVKGIGSVVSRMVQEALNGKT